MRLFSSRAHRAFNFERGGIFFRLLFLIFLAVVLVLLYLVRYPILRLAGNFWVVDEAPKASDAIIILGDDNYYADRAARAADLFKSSMAPRIVASGPFLRPYASIPELIQHDLADRGVAASAIVRFPHRADNTLEEARALSQLISSHGWKRVLVVTSNFHTRRARYILERAFPAGTELRIISARDTDYDPDNWWRTRRGQKLFFHEFVGMFEAMWELRHNDVQTSNWSLARSDDLPLAKLYPIDILPVYS
ncbi:MAG: YdcF family protein [Candidatus Acidiferrales bacterium]